MPLRRPRKLSTKGAEFIARFEGFRSAPYNDAAGHATIGFGHLIHMGPVTDADRRKWGKLTYGAALKLLQKDAAIAAKSVYKNAKPTKQSRFDALVSFTFNVGTGAFERSTLLKKHQAKDYPGAANEFAKWDMAGGRHLLGLTRRRQAERRLYLLGKYV